MYRADGSGKGCQAGIGSAQRNSLRKLADEVKTNEGEAIYCIADVADENALRQAAAQAGGRI
jgi:hypothetical protein